MISIRGSLRRHLDPLAERAVASGLPPAWLGYRWVSDETVAAHVARTGQGRYETVHAEAVASNPLPRNVADRGDLPSDRGWWGYSMRDVPERVSGETFVATLPDCRLVFWTDPRKDNFYPAILTSDGRALNLREIAFRPGHAEALRAGRPAARIGKATWVLERVYHNHSHWLTAHLPKLHLLRTRGGLDDLVLPRRRNAVVDASLRMLGLDPGAFADFDPDRPLEVGELTLVGTDRFRPELLRPVRDALAPPQPGSPPGSPPGRRVFISRARSRGRRLLNEDALWPSLQAAGFERVFMEELGFEEQVNLMAGTAVLLAPHGAGLTNMMFCPPGAHVVEIADLGFPNPNFYALACAMGLHYWLVPGSGVGDGHPLEQDLRVDPDAVRGVLARLDAPEPGG